MRKFWLLLGSLFLGSIVSCTTKELQIGVLQKPTLMVKQIGISVVGYESTFEAIIISPTKVSVNLVVSGGSHLKTPDPIKVPIGAGETQTVYFKVTPRQATHINLMVDASSSSWSRSVQLKFKPKISTDLLQSQIGSVTQFSTVVEFARKLEKARLSKNSDQELEATISPIAQSNAVQSTKNKYDVQYLFNTGATPIYPAQLDEPAPINQSSLGRLQVNGSRLSVQGWGCTLGPIETVRFAIRNYTAPPSGAISDSDYSSTGVPNYARGVDPYYYGGYPLRKARVYVYDNNGAWRNLIAEGYLDDNGQFSYARPTCDTGFFLDWSHYDPQYEVIPESDTGHVTQLIQLSSPRLITGTFWDQVPQNRTIYLEANDGEVTRSLWTLNLLKYAEDFTGIQTKVNIRINALGTFAPIGQVFLKTEDWRGLYPMVHEFGHNTLYSKTISSNLYGNFIRNPQNQSTTFGGCMFSFVPCVPDFAPLINPFCSSTINTEAGLADCQYGFISGFQHIPSNYTYQYATNEGWAQATHMLIVQNFNRTTNRIDSVNNPPMGLFWDLRNCTQQSSCSYPSLIRMTNEHYVGTLFYRLITEFAADWTIQGYQTLIPSSQELNQAKVAWMNIRDNALPHATNTTVISPLTITKNILSLYQYKLSSMENNTKVCNILKDTGMTAADLVSLDIANTFQCR